MIVISKSLALVLAESGTENTPVIGYDNLVTSSNVTVTSEQTNYPGSNLGNPSTADRWRATEADPTVEDIITVALGSDKQIDYVGVAGHNFGSARIAVKLQGEFTEGVWTDLASEFMPADDRPLVVRFTPASMISVRLVLAAGLSSAQASVLYVGKLLVLPRKVYVGFSPPTFAFTPNVKTNISENGQFLGRTVVGESAGTTLPLQNLSPSWYRAYFHPFARAAAEVPFFFAWRPTTYPLEVAYAWLTNAPALVNQRPNGMVKTEMQLGAIVS